MWQVQVRRAPDLCCRCQNYFCCWREKWINVFEEEEKHDFLNLKLFFFTDIFLQAQPPQQLTFQFYYHFFETHTEYTRLAARRKIERKRYTDGCTNSRIVLTWEPAGKAVDKGATSPVSRRCEPFLTISKIHHTGKKNVLQEQDLKSECKAAP